MTIEKIVNGAALTMKIGGRLDTTTAPKLEAAVDASLTGIEDLTLDLEALEYEHSDGWNVLTMRMNI